MRFTSARARQRESAQRWASRRQGAELVRRRWEAAGNACEGCGAVVIWIEVAHLWGKGRSAKVSEQYASSAELMAALCCADTWVTRIGCHELIDRGLDPELRRDLRMAAAVRFARAHGLDPPSPLSDPYDAVLGMVRVLEQQG